MNKRTLYLSFLLLFGATYYQIALYRGVQKVNVTAECGQFLAENIVKNRLGLSEDEAKQRIKKSLGFLGAFVNTKKKLSSILQLRPIKKAHVKSVIKMSIEKRLRQVCFFSNNQMKCFIKDLDLEKIADKQIDEIVAQYNSLFKSKRKRCTRFEIRKVFSSIEMKVDKLFSNVETRVTVNIVGLYLKKLFSFISTPVVFVCNHVQVMF